MSKILKSVSGVLSGAGRAAKAYPATVLCAVAFAVISLLQIQFDLSRYEFVLSCMKWALALGAIFGMAAVAAQECYFSQKNAPLASNLLALGVAVIVYIALYLSGAGEGRVSETAGMRVLAAMFVSIVAYVMIAGRRSEETDFVRSLFMAHKSFFIAFIYGLVALVGASGVAGAVQGLIYPDMSSKVYGYITTLAGLLAFLLFVGYFPPLGAGKAPERREQAQRKPQFIAMLLSYILIPIMLALTVVLLIWALLNVIGITKSDFGELAAIAAAYTIGGLWLHAMTSDSEAGVAKLYRAVYPVAAIIILIFEAWAVIRRLLLFGLKTTEYAFILIWVLAAAGSLLLLAMRDRDRRKQAHRAIAAVACALVVVAVLPAVGYIDLPVAAQVARLQSLLESEGMLKDGKLIPAAEMPSPAARAAITDAVDFLAYSEGKLPAWFDKDLAYGEVFREKMGFDKLWLNEDGTPSGGDLPHGIFLYAEPEAIRIEEFTWAVNLTGRQADVVVKTNRGEYIISWQNTVDKGSPSIKITLDGNVEIERSLEDFISQLADKYSASSDKGTIAQSELLIELEGQNIYALLTLSEVSISEYEGKRSVWVSPSMLYIKEK